VGARGHGPQTHDRLKKSCESCCRRDSSVSTLAMIKFVTYSPPGKIMFSAFFCRSSSAFDRATVSLEYQPGQAYWRSGPGRITVHKEASTQMGRRMHQNTHFEIEKKMIFFWPPFPILHCHCNIWEWIFLCFRRSTWPPEYKSRIRPCSNLHRTDCRDETSDLQFAILGFGGGAAWRGGFIVVLRLMDKLGLHCGLWADGLEIIIAVQTTHKGSREPR